MKMTISSEIYKNINNAIYCYLERKNGKAFKFHMNDSSYLK